MRCGQSVAISQSEIRKLLLRFQTKNDNLVETVKIPLKTSHGIFTLRLPTPSITKMNIGIVTQRNPNLSIH